MSERFSMPVLTLVMIAAAAARGADLRVRDADGLRKAAAAAKPGDKILLEPGEYPGGFSFKDLRGAPGKPILIGAADRERPPVFRGGGNAMQLTDPQHVVIENLAITGATGNGLNVDDGGSFDSPARDVVFRGLKISDIGPRGNNDGIKLSGVVDFRVEGCAIERWGTRGGSAIDMVGCHKGVIEGNVFRHTDEEGCSGVQAKGGSSEIQVRRNRFERAGGRAINVGGSTGFEYFRPPIDAKKAAPGTLFEAKDILVEGNVFTGSAAPVAFVGVDGAKVRHNTFYKPRRWALRILQETRDAAFVPSRGGEITDNVIVFEARGWGGAANVGPGTAPETFRFARNVWYAADDPGRSRQRLPSAEEGAIDGRDPLLADPEKGDFRVREGSSAAKAGAHVIDRELSPAWPLGTARKPS